MTIETPSLLFAAILILLTVGLATLAWGRRLPRQAGWAVAIALVLLFGVAVFGWNELFFGVTEKKIWFRGWILPNDEHGAVTVGILEDSVGLATSALAALLAGFAMLEATARKRRVSESRPERSLAAIAISAAGVALAWLSLTPWLSLIGVSIVALGGFLGLGARWGENDDYARSATRFAWEKWWGIIFAWVGAGILAGARAPLTWATSGEAAAWGTAQFSDEIGASLLMLGLFVQVQSFPFLGWVVSPSTSPILPRVLLNQLAPGLGAFALLIRLEPHLRDFRALEVFGWIALFSAAVTIGVGLVQATWRQSLAGWISAGFATAFAILSFSGAPGAFGFIIGLVLGTVVLAAAIAALGTREPGPTGTAPGWLKTLAFIGAASATGLAGFVSAFGVLQWITSEAMAPGWAALPFLVYFLFALNGWSLAWGALKTRAVTGAAWYQVLALFLLVGFSLAVVWTGSLSGGFLGAADVVSASLVESMFGAPATSRDSVGSPVWFYFAIQLISFGMAYWMVGRSRDLWLGLRERFPRAVEFVSSGFQIDLAATRGFAGTRAIGNGFQWLFERILWEKGLTRALSVGIGKGSRLLSNLDASLSSAILRTFSKTVNAPAKFLQLVQNGDIQWYVLFAIGSGAAILLHFLISKEWMS